MFYALIVILALAVLVILAYRPDWIFRALSELNRIKAAMTLSARNKTLAWYSRAVMQTGVGVVELIIYVFVAIVLIYRIIPEIGSENATVQASANVSDQSKWVANLGEWLLPFLAIITLVFLLLRHRSNATAE